VLWRIVWLCASLGQIVRTFSTDFLYSFLPSFLLSFHARMTGRPEPEEGAQCEGRGESGPAVDCPCPRGERADSEEEEEEGFGVFGDLMEEDRDDDDNDDDEDEDEEEDRGLGSTLTDFIEDGGNLGELMLRAAAAATVISIVGPDADAPSEAEKEEPSSSCCMMASSSCRMRASRRSSSASSSPSCASFHRGRKRLGGGQQPYAGTPQQEPEVRAAEAEEGSLRCCSRPCPVSLPGADEEDDECLEEEQEGRRRKALDCSSPRLLGCRVESSRPLVLEESILVERLL